MFRDEAFARLIPYTDTTISEEEFSRRIHQVVDTCGTDFLDEGLFSMVRRNRTKKRSLETFREARRKHKVEMLAYAVEASIRGPHGEKFAGTATAIPDLAPLKARHKIFEPFPRILRSKLHLQEPVFSPENSTNVAVALATFFTGEQRAQIGIKVVGRLIENTRSHFTSDETQNLWTLVPSLDHPKAQWFTDNGFESAGTARFDEGEILVGSLPVAELLVLEAA